MKIHLNKLKKSASSIYNGKNELNIFYDTFIEGVHFDLSYTTARELGHRSLVSLLSATIESLNFPTHVGVSIGLKQEQGDIFVSELLSGIIRLSKSIGVKMLPENTVQSPSFSVLNLVVVTEKINKNLRPLKNNDIVIITGGLGASAAGLSFLKKIGRKNLFSDAINSHLSPPCRVEVFKTLIQKSVATSIVSLRDGLAFDLNRLSSGIEKGLLIEEKLLPISKACLKVSKYLGTNPFSHALYGAEDFELVFTARPKDFNLIAKLLKPLKITIIGKVVSEKGVFLKNTDGDIINLRPKMWTHFVRRSKSR